MQTDDGDLDRGYTGYRPRLDSYYSANSRRSTYYSAANSSYQSFDSTSIADGGPRHMYGPPSQLPSLTQPVPANWKCIDGN